MDPLALNNYYKQFTRGLIDLDEAADRTRIDYQSALDTLRRNRRRDLQGLSAGQADRGLTHSGAGLLENMNMQEAYNRRQAGLTQDKSSRLATIARRRLDTESDLNEVRAFG